jgi:hypothetical protein
MRNRVVGRRRLSFGVLALVAFVGVGCGGGSGGGKTGGSGGPVDGGAGTTASGGGGGDTSADAAAGEGVSTGGTGGSSAGNGGGASGTGGSLATGGTGGSSGTGGASDTGGTGGGASGGTGACAASPTTRLTKHYIYGVDLSTSATKTFSMPKGFQVKGTVTLPNVPAFGTYSYGGVRLIDTVGDRSYDALTTPSANNAFTYSVSVPAGSYDVVASLALRLDAGNVDTRLIRYSFATIVVCGDTTSNVTLPAVSALTQKSVTLTGLSALGSPNAEAFGVLLDMQTLDKTLQLTGTAKAQGDSATIKLYLTEDTFVPYPLIEDDAVTSAMPPKSGFTARPRLPPAPAAASYTFAWPAMTKLSGTVSDPGKLMVQRDPMDLAPLTTYLSCVATDAGASPILSEASTEIIYSDTPSYRTFIRKGSSCILSGNFVVQLGPGGAPMYNQSENNYGYLTLPFTGGETIAATIDLVRDVAVPSLGTEVKVVGSVVEGPSSTPVASCLVSAISTTLANADLAKEQIAANVFADASGTFKLNVPTGTYTIVLRKY